MRRIVPAAEALMIWLFPIRRVAVQRIGFPILLLLSALMIIVWKIDRVTFEILRLSVSDRAALTLEALSRPIDSIVSMIDRAWAIFDVYDQNARLTEENARLSHWQQAALALSFENARLRDLLKLVPGPAVSYVTARVVANSGGAFVRNLMVDTGIDGGVGRGQAAVTGEGLVGRVSEVGKRAARILPITDLNSRVPVILERSRQRAILAGDNSERPSLLYLAPAASVRIGDRIVTSGEGGVFPPGLPIGVIAIVGGEATRVQPYVELSQVEYVRIVDYGLADLLPKPVATRRSTGGEGCQ
jgi:rod shape-determining protein MreC